MSQGPRDHPDRQALTREIHARPYARLSAPQRVSHLAMLSGEGAGSADRAHLLALCRRYDVPAPAEDADHVMLDLGPFRLKWERHTEFTSYTFFDADEAALARESQPFAQPVLAKVPKDWLEELPGELIVGVHLEMETRERKRRDVESLSALFGTDNIAGSEVAGGAAAVWMDFAVREDGFGRILLHDRHLQPRQGGRLIQRLLEIETYRMLALLALPLARQHGRTLTQAGQRLAEITARMGEIVDLDDERRLLGELTELSIEIEQGAAATNYRFGAARAYDALVRRRVEELREVRIEGFQTIQEFLERRLGPAMRTCEAVAQRLDTLSWRLARASQLLRTRVDVALEAQNRDLLRSMNRRARLQLRLQQTVEGLSVAAISYYLVGLISYAAKGAQAGGLALDPEVVAGVSIPFVVGLVGFGVWRLRRHLRNASEPGETRVRSGGGAGL